MMLTKKTTNKKLPIITSKEELKELFPEIVKEILDKMSVMQYLMFITCLTDKKIVLDDLADNEFEISEDVLRKACYKNVKDRLFNVKDGVFTISKYGHEQIKKHITYK